MKSIRMKYRVVQISLAINFVNAVVCHVIILPRARDRKCYDSVSWPETAKLERVMHSIARYIAERKRVAERG